jgi:hypothetical protein
MRWMEACYGRTDVMERSCAVARGIDINILYLYIELSRIPNGYFTPLLDPGGGFRSETAVT